MPAREGTYGLLAEFDTPSDLVRAAQQARQDGWRRMDCYTPYPVEEAAEAIGFHRNKVPLLTLIGGLMGGAAMFSLETWISVLAYPLNIAGRPTVFLAGFHRSRLRVDHSVGRTFGGLRHAGAEWTAVALSSAVQRAQLPRRRDDGQVFPVP